MGSDDEMASVSGICLAEMGEYSAIPSLIVKSDGIRIQRMYSPERLPRWLTNARVVSFAFTRELERSKGCILERERERTEILALVCLPVYSFVKLLSRRCRVASFLRALTNAPFYSAIPAAYSFSPSSFHSVPFSRRSATCSIQFLSSASYASRGRFICGEYLLHVGARGNLKVTDPARQYV